jgi:hypothetical protein
MHKLPLLMPARAETASQRLMLIVEPISFSLLKVLANHAAIVFTLLVASDFSIHV